MSYPTPGTQASYYNREKFVRPAHRLLALHGKAVVPIAVLGLAAGRVTEGHRFQGRREIGIDSALAWAPALEAEGKVIPSFDARRAAIEAELAKQAQGDTPIAPDALLDEVTSLVEQPAVYAGTFDPALPRGAAGVPHPDHAAEPEVLRADRCGRTHARALPRRVEPRSRRILPRSSAATSACCARG